MLSAPNPDQKLLNSPESLIDLTWKVKPGSEQKITGIQELLSQNGFYWSGDKAFTGGRLLFPEGIDETDRKVLAENRPFLVIPLKKSPQDLEYSSVAYIPSEVGGGNEPAFVQNKRVDGEYVSEFIREEWKKTHTSRTPVPEFQKVIETPSGPAVIVEYIPKMSHLGEGGSENSIHEADPRKIPDDDDGLNNLFDYLEAAHPLTSEFSAWLAKNNISLPDSWIRENKPDDDTPDGKFDIFCNLRGDQWWYNPKRNITKYQMQEEKEYGDRMYELSNIIINNENVRRLFQDYETEIRKTDEDFSFPSALEKMIKNNLPLYRFQNGKTELKIDDENILPKDTTLLGTEVVVNGIMSPSNIQTSLDSQTGKTVYTQNPSDRKQRYGLRGQMIDWLVSSLAADPKKQIKLINKFIERYPDPKDRRGLAMHIMYRAISESAWFAGKGKIDQARNLVKLAGDIIRGDGRNWANAWNEVNTPLI